MRGAQLCAMPSGALWWPRARILCVSDLHLGKSDRFARRGGPLLPPYEVRETLMRLENDIHTTAPQTVVCLGDSFDDARAADSLDGDEKTWLTRLQAGRNWIWIQGNHDPGPIGLAGTHLAELLRAPLTFRHIPQPGAVGEVSGHFHPKFRLRTRGRTVTRRCFIHDANRLLMPAYGTFTGGLHSDDAAIRQLFQPGAFAILTGDTLRVVPLTAS
ncbi:MAG: ligase-associated DNA damage response endonuclease PdeM [Paracoccaceae bacterium]